MKTALFATAGLFLCCAGAQAADNPKAVTPVAAIDPVRLEKARALVEVTVPATQRQAMFTKVIDAFMGNQLSGIMKASPELGEVFQKNEELRQIFSSFVARQRTLVLKDLEETTPELLTAYTHAYARNFTSEDMDGLITFLSTPLGQKYVARSSELLADPDFGEWQQGIALRAQARQKDELKKLMEDIMPILRAEGAKSNGS